MSRELADFSFLGQIFPVVFHLPCKFLSLIFLYLSTLNKLNWDSFYFVLYVPFAMLSFFSHPQCMTFVIWHHFIAYSPFLALSFLLSYKLCCLSHHIWPSFSSFILIPQAGPSSHPLSCWSSDGIDRRVAWLLIAAPNEWNWGQMEEGGKERQMTAVARTMWSLLMSVVWAQWRC